MSLDWLYQERLELDDPINTNIIQSLMEILEAELVELFRTRNISANQKQRWPIWPLLMDPAQWNLGS